VSSCIRSCVVPARSASSPLRAYGRRNPRASRKCRLRKARCGQRLPEALTRQRVSETPRTCFEGPFGEVIRATGPMAKANPFRFSTKYQDDETDLLYYGYRYYNASTGRWISRDPIGEVGFHVQTRGAPTKGISENLIIGNIGENSYLFVRNDPLTTYDFLGLACCGTKQDLLDTYNDGAKFLRNRSVPPGGIGEYSCFNINFNVLLYIQQACIKCWTCRLEHRSRFVLLLNNWYDHWAVVCKSDETREELLFDYWGNRPAGEHPNTWFRERYPALGGYNDKTESFEDEYRNGFPCNKLPGNPLDTIPPGKPEVPPGIWQ